MTDRPTKAHEYLFLLSKEETYFYDAESIKEPVKHPEDSTGEDIARAFSRRRATAPRPHQEKIEPSRSPAYPAMRNRRSVWSVPSQPYHEAHFATFPPRLVEPCIRAGTSEKGCCSACGAPLRRVVLATTEVPGRGSGNAERRYPSEDGYRDDDSRGRHVPWAPTAVSESAWQASCACVASLAPCVVLDPFSGAGTTGLVARRLQRAYVGIEINPEYVAMQRRRLDDDQPLFNRSSLVGAGP